MPSTKEPLRPPRATLCRTLGPACPAPPTPGAHAGPWPWTLARLLPAGRLFPGAANLCRSLFFSTSMTVTGAFRLYSKGKKKKKISETHAGSGSRLKDGRRLGRAPPTAHRRRQISRIASLYFLFFSKGPVTPAGEKRIVKVSPGRPAARGGASADEVIATFASVPRPSKAAAALQPEAFRRLCSGLRPQSRHDPRSPEPGARASQPSHGAPQRCCHQPVPSH